MALPADPDRPPTARSRHTLFVLVVVGVGAAAAVALDQYLEAERDRQAAAGPADPARLRAPDVASWRGTPLAVGDPAPGFALEDARTGETVSLDGSRGRPVVLVLSSYGCNVFCRELGGIADLSARYRGRAVFLFVAIRDAGHPDPVFSPPVEAPRPGEAAADARRRQVREGAAHLGLPFPALVDADGQAEAAYAAFPKRLVIVGADGRIAYDGGRGAAGGPSAWDLAVVERHLRAALSGG